MKEQAERLEKLLKKMDVPEFRRHSYPWLKRNLAIRNSKHPDFEEASQLIALLIERGYHV